MNQSLTIALICLFLFSLVTSIHAQDPVTENLKKRLQESLQPSPSPSPALSQFRAYVGTVKDVIGTTIVVDHKDGKKDVKIEDSTTILRAPGNTAIKSTNINIGDSIIAIGIPDTDEILLGKRLIVSSTQIAAPAKITAIGTVKALAKSTLTLSIGDLDKKIFVTSKTVYKSPAGPIELADVTVGDTVIYNATLDDDDLPAGEAGQTATILMRIKTGSLEPSN